MQRTVTRDLGPAAGLEAVRPTLAELEHARAKALREGDRRRLTVYEFVIARRLEAARRAAAA
jgi:hypothetical protein